MSDAVRPPEDDDVLGPELVECPVCLATGLPERIAEHDCQAFLARQRQWSQR